MASYYKRICFLTQSPTLLPNISIDNFVSTNGIVVRIYQRHGSVESTSTDESGSIQKILTDLYSFDTDYNDTSC